MNDYEENVKRRDRMENRIKRLELGRDIFVAEINDIIADGQIDLKALNLRVDAERYDGKHLEVEGDITIKEDQHKREGDDND